MHAGVRVHSEPGLIWGSWPIRGDSDIPEAYRLDLDNDGQDDVYARDKPGRGRWLVYSIYQWAGDRWFAIDPNLYYQGFEQFEAIGYDFSHESNIIFVTDAGMTYAVAALGGEGAFELHIFLIKDRAVRSIGMVDVGYRREATIQRRAP